MERAERAWAAGFFDAEGWAGAPRSRGGVRPLARINQAGSGSAPEVLTRFARAVAAGRVRGPVRQAGRLDLYRWEASSRSDVARTFAALAPWLGPVKARQFAVALGLATAPLHPARDGELAWAAGLFDGDGSTALLKHRTHPGYSFAELSITQASAGGVPEVLTRFRDAVAAGRCYGPYGGSATHQPVYRWKAMSVAEVELVLAAIWPWLSAPKLSQAGSVMAIIRAQMPLPRGNPAWGSHKTHCVHGHELASARLRPYRPRFASASTRKRTGHRGCLECLRLRARRARDASGGPTSTC